MYIHMYARTHTYTYLIKFTGKWEVVDGDGKVVSTLVDVQIVESIHNRSKSVVGLQQNTPHVSQSTMHVVNGWKSHHIASYGIYT